MLRCFLFLSLLPFLAGCLFVGSKSQTIQDSGPPEDVDVSHVKDAVPRFEPIKKAGNSSPYTVLGKTYRVNFEPEGYAQRGYASWYGRKFHGRKTANGETYDMFAMTAAHKSLPIPSYVRVTNVTNNRTVVVRVNDRGPFHPGRVIDLSYAAAKKLDIHTRGTGEVTVEYLSTQKIPEPAIDKPLGLQFIQLGAFKSDAGAARAKARWQPVFQNVVVNYSSADGFHRVLIGPFTSRDELLLAKRKLSDRKVSDYKVVTL